MIFGQKERELRAQLAEVQQDMNEARPFLPFAEQIGQQVGHLAASGVELDVALTEAIHNVSTEARKKSVQNIFDKLSPSEQIDRLFEVYGDEEMKIYLEAKRQSEIRRLQKQGQTLLLAEAAQEEGKVDIRHITEGSTIVIGMYSATSTIRTTSDEGRRGVARTIRGQITPGQDIHVLNDSNNKPHMANLEHHEFREMENAMVADHTIIALGTEVTEAGSRYFRPVLYRNTLAAQHIDGCTEVLNVEVGTVEVDGISLFGN